MEFRIIRVDIETEIEMQIVATIRAGHIIETTGNRFTVVGNMKVRGRYLYVCADQSGRKVSLGRDDVLQAQRDGDAVVVAT